LGGGVALLRAIKALEKLKVHNDDQRTGIDIVKKALSWPARQIAINAGEDGSIEAALDEILRAAS
jgi:chaperonin GroEL